MLKAVGPSHRDHVQKHKNHKPPHPLKHLCALTPAPPETFPAAEAACRSVLQLHRSDLTRLAEDMALPAPQPRLQRSEALAECHARLAAKRCLLPQPDCAVKATTLAMHVDSLPSTLHVKLLRITILEACPPPQAVQPEPTGACSDCSSV